MSPLTNVREHAAGAMATLLVAILHKYHWNARVSHQENLPPGAGGDPISEHPWTCTSAALIDILGVFPREGARAADTKRAQEVLVPVSLQYEEIVTHVQTVWEGLRRDRGAATWPRWGANQGSLGRHQHSAGVILAIAALGTVRGQRHLCQVAETAGITQGLSTVRSVSARGQETRQGI
mmetsp:Transcript_48517/g.128582  ORF Transcript_48517/g.128582 Transcript_48517/m.128582 type:complete len:179 (+) Transcript_48517:1873-2409(+)